MPVEATDAAVADALPSLVAAQRLRAMAFGWTAGAFCFSAIAAMALGLGLLLWAASHVAAFVFVAVAVAAGVLTSAAWSRSAARRKEAREKLDDAWERVADEVVRARGAETTAAELARAMHTDESLAETLLARLSAHGRVRVDVREDADLAYRVDTGAPEEAEAPPPAEETSRATRR